MKKVLIVLILGLIILAGAAYFLLQKEGDSAPVPEVTDTTDQASTETTSNEPAPIATEAVEETTERPPVQRSTSTREFDDDAGIDPTI